MFLRSGGRWIARLTGLREAWGVQLFMLAIVVALFAAFGAARLLLSLTRTLYVHDTLEGDAEEPGMRPAAARSSSRS